MATFTVAVALVAVAACDRDRSSTAPTETSTTQPGQPAQMADLVNTSWVAESIDRGDGTQTLPVPPREDLDLVFLEGTLSGSDGCNRYGGDYRLEDGKLVLAVSTITEIGCSTAEAIRDGVATGSEVRIDGDELVLIAVDGAVLRFSRTMFGEIE